MTSNLFPKSGDILIDETLSQAAGGLLYFFDENTTDPRIVYTDAALAVPHANPVECNAYGRIPKIYLPYGSYGVLATTAAGVKLYDIDNITNPEPASSGGGGGITVTIDQVVQTGDVKARLGEGAHAGFVRLNGRTIGKATSGATERANDDTEDLFEFLWNGFTQPSSSSLGAFVSAGRGANAAADFAAGKTITLFDTRGRVLPGVDTMGTTTASRIQTSTTISTTNGSSTATVASIANLAIGMTVYSTNVPSGTTITGIGGSNVTLSANATATASGTAVRFSFFTNDAEKVGSYGGSQHHRLALDELKSHNHGGVTTGASATLLYDKPVFSSITTSTAFPASNLNVATVFSSTVVDNQSRTHGILNAGNDLPHNNIQPSMTITYYVKL